MLHIISNFTQVQGHHTYVSNQHFKVTMGAEKTGKLKAQVATEQLFDKSKSYILSETEYTEEQVH